LWTGHQRRITARSSPCWRRYVLAVALPPGEQISEEYVEPHDDEAALQNGDNVQNSPELHDYGTHEEADDLTDESQEVLNADHYPDHTVEGDDGSSSDEQFIVGPESNDDLQVKSAPILGATDQNDSENNTPGSSVAKTKLHPQGLDDSILNSVTIFEREATSDDFIAPKPGVDEDGPVDLEPPFETDWEGTFEDENEFDQDTNWVQPERDHDVMSNESSATLSSNEDSTKALKRSFDEVDDEAESPVSPLISPGPKRPRVRGDVV